MKLEDSQRPSLKMGKHPWSSPEPYCQLLLLLLLSLFKISESFRVVGSDGYIDYQYGSSAQSLVSLLTDFEPRDQPSNCRILNRWLGGFEAIDSRVTSRLVWLLISVD